MQFDGPVLELMTDARTRLDQRIAGLGPDILAPELDEPRILRLLREDDPTRPIGDALLDQRTVAGHREPLEERGLLGARRSIRGAQPGAVGDEEVLTMLRLLRPADAGERAARGESP